jgi:ComF family protein
VLLPQSCLLCAADCGNALLCPACHDGLPRLPDTRCPRCALPTPQGAVCGNCLKQAPHFDATVAAFDYAFPVDKLVQQLKYAHRLAVADFFANALLREELPSVELVIPLPLSNSRLRERGFNQAVEIARPIARALDLPLALTSCTRRVDTAPQAMLPWKERRKNVKNAFECTVDLGGRSLLLVDDVMTTGATLDECARVLKDHGAGTICCCVTARTV